MIDLNAFFDELIKISSSAARSLETNLLSSLRRIRPEGRLRVGLRAAGTVGAYIRNLLKGQ